MWRKTINLLFKANPHSAMSASSVCEWQTQGLGKRTACEVFVHETKITMQRKHS